MRSNIKYSRNAGGGRSLKRAGNVAWFGGRVERAATKDTEGWKATFGLYVWSRTVIPSMLSVTATTANWIGREWRSPVVGQFEQGSLGAAGLSTAGYDWPRSFLPLLVCLVSERVRADSPHTGSGFLSLHDPDRRGPAQPPTGAA